YKGNDVYATTKLFAAWWAAELATRLPKGATVNAVSPGATPDTDADRNGTWFLRRVMMPMFKFMPGMSHTIADGAGRYLEAAGYSDDVTGKFFASPPKKMIGPLTEMNQPHLDNPAAQVALWNVTNAVAGVAAPAAT
ncbi:MAG: short-chain dehydrogenase, partial [Actinomycetota bacterium]|nr:short-chain dehydrogenase [Actinomycetota bacterium]